MLPSDIPRFSALLSDVMAYYGKNVSSFTQDVFWNACKVFDFEQIAKAFEAHAQEPEHGRFAPKVADLVRVLAGTKTDRAALAWGKTLEAMSAVGAYQDVVFDDPAIHAAIEDLGGWPKVCRTNMDELGYLQHKFCESHRAYTGRGQFEYPPRLGGAGGSEGEYLKVGRKPPPPVLIGDPEACRQVFEGGSAGGKTQITFAAAARQAAPRVVDAQRIGRDVPAANQPHNNMELKRA
jgi:hypothetical protein